MFHIIMHLFVEDGLDEYDNDRNKRRAQILSKFNAHREDEAYNNTESYGRSNDALGGASSAPLPYIPPTEQTEDGYIGLAPPLA